MKSSRGIGAPAVFLMAAMGFASAQTRLATQSRDVDFSASSSTKPAQVGSAIPAVCSTGQMFFDSSAPAGQNLYGCTSTNVWSLLAGTGGGGGAGMASQLGDFIATDTSAAVQTLGALCSNSTPCQIRIGTAAFTMTAPTTLTLSGATASGTVFWYLSSSQTLTAGHNSAATLTCSAGCSVVTGIVSFPPDSVPLWETTFTSNVWDPITLQTMDKRAIFSRDVIAPGSGVLSASNPSTGVQTLSTDPTQVPRYFAGSGAPSINCTAGRDFYTDTTGQNLYFCYAANTWLQVPSLSKPTTVGNCSSSASPAICGAAAAGSLAIPIGTTSVSLVVNTTAVTANSQIFVFPDDTLGTKLSVTCNSTLATLAGGLAITGRAAGASFTVTYNGTITTNPLCANFVVVN